jgi:hypothetical protein
MITWELFVMELYERLSKGNVRAVVLGIVGTSSLWKRLNKWFSSTLCK